ncbi:uncharacterized protein ACMZJ9_009931 [Mantella aurantiaca]
MRPVRGSRSEHGKYKEHKLCGSSVHNDAEVVKTRMNKRAGREEFYVHYVGLNCRQNEWVDKTRLVLVKSVEEEEEEKEEKEEVMGEEEEEEVVEEEEEENTVNETDQETSKNENSDEDEPQPKIIKVEIHEAPANSSVVASDDFAEELTCLLCKEIFKDPVMMECGHNFCRSCLDQAWEGQDSFTCPDCKEVITEKKYTINRALANLVKKTAVPAVRMAKKEKIRPPENCLIHDERLKLFCKDDGDLGCVICRESLKHAKHNFLPILDAMGVYRKDLSSIVTPLEEALKVTEEMAKQQSEKIGKHKADMKDYREHIETEFKKLHGFLNKREQELLKKLHDEGDKLLTEMEANISKMQENIDSIKESIASASEKLDDTDSISFLTDIKSFINKYQEQQKEALSSGNTIIDKQLSKDTYKAPIQFSVCEEMMTSVAQKPKEIWIIGNFWVTHSANVARKRPNGQNLGFDEKQFTVRWMGNYSLMWHELLPDLSRAASTIGDPDIVFINLGSSELGQEKYETFLSVVKRDFDRLVESYPNTTFIWSSVMPRKEWTNSYMETQRQKFNSTTSGFAKQLGFQVSYLWEFEKLLKNQLRQGYRAVLHRPYRTWSSARESLSQSHILNANELLNIAEPKEIWIFGNYWVTQAARVASTSSYGKTLGFDESEYTIRWMDKSNLRWFDLLPDLKNAVSSDLEFLLRTYRNTNFIWSAILPREEWINNFVEEKMKKFNFYISEFAESCGIQVARFNEVMNMSKEQFLHKDKGEKYTMNDLCDVFNRNLKEFLDIAISNMKKKEAI